MAGPWLEMMGNNASGIDIGTIPEATQKLPGAIVGSAPICGYAIHT